MCPKSRGGRKLFVGQLPKDTTDSDLKALMAPFGEIVELFMMKNKKTGLGTGAGFVVFSTRESAQAAVRHYDGKIRLQNVDRPMHVRLAEGEAAPDTDVKLFVGHIPPRTSEKDVKAVFDRYGNLIEVAILRREGRSRGCAFVRFNNRAAADQCIAALHGTMPFPESSLPLTVRMATTEADKRERRESRRSDQSSDSVSTPPEQPLGNAPPVAPAAVPHWGTTANEGVVGHPYPMHPMHMGPWMPAPGHGGSL